MGADGRRQILALLHPGELIGGDLIGGAGYSLEACSVAEVCNLDRRRFEALLARDAGLRRAVLRSRMDELEEIRWLTWCLGALRLEERVCAFLLYATKVMPFEAGPEGDGILALDLPRADIVDLIGTTIESFSRITHRLHERGVIEILDPAHFRIPDLGALVEAGGLRDIADVPASGATLAAAARALAQQASGRQLV
jgi:CRP/FNR family transcriptional regulator